MLVLSLLSLASTAYAIDADPFDPSGSLAHAKGTLQGESPHLSGDGPAFGVHLAMADDLVMVNNPNTGEAAPVLSSAFSQTLYGGWTINGRARVEAFLPVYGMADAPLAPFRGAALGDARVQGLIPVWQRGDELGVAIKPFIALPLGGSRSSTALLNKGVSGGLTAAIGGEYEDFGYLTNLGVTLASAQNLGSNLRMGSTFDALVGGWYNVDERLRIGAEVEAEMGLAAQGQRAPNNVGTWHGFLQATTPQGIGMTVGGGTGLLLDGVGAPRWRLFANLTYAPIASDKDEDGYTDDVDACPLDPEDFDLFEDDDGCPELDNDGDSIPDASDACPLEPEDFDDWEDADGCPELDNDMDTVLDADDACPIEAGLVEFEGCPDTDSDGLVDAVDECPNEAGPLSTNGCPDRDSDLVPDFRDKCPDDPKPVDEDPATSDGCPKRVYVTAKAIRITEKVLFDSGRATIKSESNGLLDEVVQLMKDNPRIKKVEVAGHTDAQGSDAMNQKLSERRAAAVVTYLTDNGIEESRLRSAGFGETLPIDSNRTAAGRANNRRVEFNIVEQDAAIIERKFDPSRDASKPAAGKEAPPNDGVGAPASTETVIPAAEPAPAPESAKAESPSEMVLQPTTEITLPETTAGSDLASPWDLPEKPRGK